MGYVWSRYNVITNYKDYIAVHNLVSHKGNLLPKEKAYLLLDSSEKDLEESIKKQLIENGILVPKDVCEIDTIREMRNKLIENRRRRLSVTIIPTYQCNFKCIYCWEDTKHRDDCMTEETQEELLKYLERKMPDCSALDIDWFGGEPLLGYKVMHRLLDEIDILCRKYKIPYSSTLTTNGFGLTPEIATYLVEHHNYFFQITLDGPKELHDFNRPLKSGAGTYEVILENLRKIRDCVDSHHLRVVIRINVTNDSAGQVEKLLPLIGSEFGGDQRFRVYIQAVERHNDKRYDVMRGRYLKENSIIEKLYDNCIELGILTTPLKMLKPGDLMCKTVYKNSVFVSSDGYIYKCDMNMTPNDVSCIGKVPHYKDEEECWEKQWNEHIKESDYCTECLLFPLCFGMKCPFYTDINVRNQCEYFNDYSIVKSAVKSYAQQGKYAVL